MFWTFVTAWLIFVSCDFVAANARAHHCQQQAQVSNSILASIILQILALDPYPN